MTNSSDKWDGRSEFDPITSTPDGGTIWRDYGDPRRIIVTRKGELPQDAIARENAAKQKSKAVIQSGRIELMADLYKKWLNEVQAALRSINMPFDDWQSRWQFNFEQEFRAGVKADNAAMKANRYWWHEQNKSLNQDCRKMPNCWLPRGHQGECQPVSMPTYERGDYVKVEFPGDAGMPSEWMWVRVHRCDTEKRLVYGTLDNEPLNDYDGKVGLGSELAVSYSQIREHRKPTEFTRQ